MSAIEVRDLLTGEAREVGSFPNGFSYGSLPYPFSPSLHTAGGRGLLWVGISSSGDILGFQENGERISTIKRSVEPGLVTSQLRDAFKDFALERYAGDARRQIDGFLKDVEFPDHLPAFGPMEVDGEGNLWVSRYRAPWSEATPVWDVFNARGVQIASVQAPDAWPRVANRSMFPTRRSNILDIGADYIVVRGEDEWGADQIMVFRIVK
jgi:hypothetical protein